MDYLLRCGAESFSESKSGADRLPSRFTRVYGDWKPFWDREAFPCVKKVTARWASLTVDSHQAHLTIARHPTETARPAVVIAGNGMCSGSRIVSCPKAILHNPRPSVLFIGYQAQGASGRTIQIYVHMAVTQNRTDNAMTSDLRSIP